MKHKCTKVWNYLHFRDCCQLENDCTSFHLIFKMEGEVGDLGQWRNEVQTLSSFHWMSLTVLASVVIISALLKNLVLEFAKITTMDPIGSSPELSAFDASCRFRKVAWILVLQIPALLVQNKTHMVNMDEAPNFHKMLKPELKLNTCEAMVQKLLARKLLLFRCSMMASLVLFSLF